LSEVETGALGAGRIEPRELEQEMRSSFLDYAMSVIVSRALPDVRDGLKPVHRRVLYGMHEAGLQPNRPYKKSATTVGNVMGRYHPHGDQPIYDTLVRMAQPFSLRYPLVDGQGNFGSIDDDPPAAMRYCVTNDTRIETPQGTLRIGDLLDAKRESDNDVDLEVLDRLGRPVRATKLFHSGEHPTLRIRTREGYELTGTHNHPCSASSTWLACRCSLEAARRDRDGRSCAHGADGPRRTRNGSRGASSRRHSCSARSYQRAGPATNMSASPIPTSATSTMSLRHTTRSSRSVGVHLSKR